MDKIPFVIFSFLCVLFLIIVLFSEMHRHNQIIGGSDSYPTEFPWQVSIQWRRGHGGSPEHICGGTILDRNKILTAAHCIHTIRNHSHIDVVAGAHNIHNPNGHEQRISVARSVHLEFNMSTINNDIAILTLSSPLNFDNHTVRALGLPASGQEASGTCTVTGWGFTTNDGRETTPEELQKVQLQITNHDDCRSLYLGYNYVVNQGMICAGDDSGKKGPCKFDSGGPLVCQNEQSENYLAGIISWGDDLCHPVLHDLPRLPPVFTNVEYFKDWVDSQLQK